MERPIGAVLDNAMIIKGFTIVGQNLGIAEYCVIEYDGTVSQRTQPSSITARRDFYGFFYVGL